MTENQTQIVLLNNVAIIRPILVVLLVFYHAFVIYQGGWGAEGIPEIKTYWWLDKLSYAFMLETFVFVSGYVFGFQVRTKGERKLDAKNLFWNKFKRLIIPSILFSLLYIVLFQDITQQPVGKTIFSIVEGVGHLWFLPMLFWCFLGIWIIERLKIGPKMALSMLVLCAMVSFVPLPLQLNVALYYMLFFYVGYILQRKDADMNRFYKPQYAIATILAFTILFPLLTLYTTNAEALVSGWRWYLSDNKVITKIIEHLSINLSKIIYSSMGLAMLFVVVGIVEKKRTTPLPHWIITMGSLCMGVYLFQQFILMGLYQYSSLPDVLGYYWLPWLGFVIALSVSLGLSYLMRLTKVGRFLIG